MDCIGHAIGSSIYSNFGSLGKAIATAYPEEHWNISYFKVTTKKSVQRWLSVLLRRLLPQETTVIEDYQHPFLVWEDNPTYKIELDIWIPQYHLGIEYQGEQHYQDLQKAFGPSSTIAMYSDRDLFKSKSCSRLGIRFLAIPYWWDGTQQSLAATLNLRFPDIFPSAPPTSPIPMHPPLVK